MKPSRLFAIATVLWCAACDERGVENSARFFEDNAVFLEKTVVWLRETQTEVVWPDTDFAQARRQDSREEDELFYNELQRFMATSKLLSVNAVWLRDPKRNEQRFMGVTFLTKQTHGAFKAIRNESVVYSVSVASLDWFFRNQTCRSLNRASWHLCEWTPA